MTNSLTPIGQRARDAAAILAHASIEQKNAALQAIADGLVHNTPAILAANEKDIAAARGKNIRGAVTAATPLAPSAHQGEQSSPAKDESMLDRLRLTEARIAAMRDAVLAIRALPDPVGRLLETATRPNGLIIEKHSVPIGVIGVIFESRPNVAIDAASLCLKSGNGCILRGGGESWESVSALIAIIQAGLKQASLPSDAVQTLPSADREHVGNLLTLDTHIDLVIPRGGKSLLTRVKAESKIPVLGHLDGICHTYIDASADADKAVAITVNAKMRRTSVCGATECLLLHRKIAMTLGKKILTALCDAGCEVRAPDAFLPFDDRFKYVKPADYGHEFLAPVIAVAIVESAEEAVDFIAIHGSGHTDAIVAEDAKTAAYFLSHVNSAIALHNASTQFADGGEFGKGAEIGIATSRLHARGPVGLEELTIYQYRIRGSGQTRAL